jgi:hypothetical protein
MGIDTEEERTTDIVSLTVVAYRLSDREDVPSLNEPSKEEPRWPDVPNTIRCAAMAESGLISK